MPDNKLSENLLQPQQLNPAVELTQKVLAELDRVLSGSVRTPSYGAHRHPESGTHPA